MTTHLNEPFTEALEHPEGIPLSEMTAESIARRMPEDTEPELEGAAGLIVPLPAGYLTSEKELLRQATVRELNGFDEEKLSRVNSVENPAKFLTELLALGVEEIGGVQPDRNMVLDLLIGDRDQLMLGIRRATYGDTIDFKLTCDKCSTESEVTIDLTDPEDVPVKIMEDPMERVFEVKLRHGFASVVLINGRSQELFSENIGKKTTAEVNSLMLSKSVLEINGEPTMGMIDPVRSLSLSDRETLQMFIFEHQPGPSFNSISVSCATCAAKYQIGLGLTDLFRF